MLQPLRWVLTTLVLLLGMGALAQPQGTKQWKRVERSVSINAGAEESTQALRLAPNVVTTVLFDADIDPETVNLEGLRELFTRLEVETRLLVLKPAVAMPAQGLPPLVVRFADASAPRRLVLVLTTEGDEVDSVVDVLRLPATSEQLEAELVTLRGRCEALEGRLAAARRTPLPRGLAGALLSGAIGDNGVTRKKIEARPTRMGLAVQTLITYRSGQWLALSMGLKNPAGAAPWVPGLARLTRLDAEGRPLAEVLEAPLLMREARLAPGRSAQAVVQWPLGADSSAAVYRLEVLDEAGRRGVRWTKVEL